MLTCMQDIRNNIQGKEEKLLAECGPPWVVFGKDCVMTHRTGFYTKKQGELPFRKNVRPLPFSKSGCGGGGSSEFL